MPWRGAEFEGEFPTLGWRIAEWIQAFCVIPDGELAGLPFILTREQLRFVLRFYELDPDPDAISPKTGGPRFVHARGGQLVRPQKWGKDPLGAAIVCAEAFGPALPDGWDADGEPVGRPWKTPWIQITAISKDQTDNTWRALQPMIELGDLKADIPDTGLTRINLPGGGLIEPVTSSARSRLGQRITFSIQGESHSWLETNGGRELAKTQRRNLAGMGGRFLELTNAWDPTEESVAQRTNESPIGVCVDFPAPPPGSVRNRRERAKVLADVYGDSSWIDLDRIELDVQSLIDEGDAATAERFFLNRTQAGESHAFDSARWAELEEKGVVLEENSLIVVGVDGARFDDALAMIATHVPSGYQWPLAIIERPLDAPDDYEHDFEQADGALAEMMELHSVWRVYIDPQRIELLVDRWSGRYGEKKIIEWHTNREKQICYAVRNFRQAMKGGDVSHDGDPDFARHVANARRRKSTVKDEDGRPLFSLQKDRPGSPLKMDAGMAAVISWEARGDAIAAGAEPTPRYSVASF